MTARIAYGMPDDQVIQQCRDEMDAGRGIPGGGTFLYLENGAGQTIMSLITRQADRIKELEEKKT